MVVSPSQGYEGLYEGEDEGGRAQHRVGVLQHNGVKKTHTFLNIFVLETVHPKDLHDE